MTDFCKHYTGLMDDQCKMNVQYELFKHGTNWAEEMPCYKPDFGHRCLMHTPYRPEEIKAQNEALAEFMNQMVALQDRTSAICPHCQAQVTRLQQVGRCVYARPCGCRVYQGRVPEAWK